ncbi:hypothetical protein C8Q75DRAFT_238834 [Abortiporus biennis]|nr:hypothetical protein C8Q75DRAFT_238834 [Abortiporus biennis]
MTPWTPLKLIYYFTRYYSVVILILINSRKMGCRRWILLEGISSLLLEVLVEALLILRVNALYSGKRTVLISILTAYLCQIVVMAVSLAIGLPKVMSAYQCNVALIPVTLVIYSVASILFESLIFTLTMMKFYMALKEGWSHSTLLGVMVRDSILTFIVILVVMAGNTLLFSIAPATLAALFFPWTLAIFGSVGPRLILSLRSAYAQSIRNPSLSSPSEMPTINFASQSTCSPDNCHP